ncbi:membrane hypothetical protein [Pseudomonas sp. OF001]|uniref:hypothetical protein n=1 Tax=Pseudomonas sp. OF001 TaxID=2772300 RepID=UPI00191918EC|nr:hypothetical protein [Pseudomonas sp. OF001]CAD5377114.1 membrane hypothetical protein [Pseudomonas sp. OF001]
MKLPTRPTVMIGFAWALSSVTVVTISLAVYELVDDKRMALLYAGAFAVADLVKYMLWPTAREYFDGGRRASAVAMAVAASILAVFSGLATAERFTSDLGARAAQHQAHQQQFAVAELARSVAQQDLARLDAEAAAVSTEAAALRSRDFARAALNLTTTSDARIDALRADARNRLDTAARDLAELQAQPLPVAAPADLVPLLGLGLALVLEILPALLLTIVRTTPPANPVVPANQAASAPETAEQDDEPLPLTFAESCRRMAATARNLRGAHADQQPPHRNPPPSGPAPNPSAVAPLPRRQPHPRRAHLTPAIAT